MTGGTVQNGQNIGLSQSQAIYTHALHHNNTRKVEEPERTEPDEDRFVPANEQPEQENTTEQEQPWFSRLTSRVRRFFGGIIDSARKLWTSIRRYNPLTHALNSLECLRISSELRRAQNRNGAKIDDNEALSQYHSSLEFNPEAPCENALFRYYPSTTNKPLAVLFLGNSQAHTTPATTAGINELAERF